MSNAAKQILSKLSEAATLRKAERDKLFAEIVSSEARRVLRLIQGVAEDCRRRAATALETDMTAFLEKSAEFDASSDNGLTAEATSSLAIASDALARQMSEDFTNGVLNQDRLEMLIGGGIGMHIVGTALLHKFVARSPDK